MTEQETGGAVSRAIRSYFREFGALKDCGREFWVVQLVNLLDGIAYFAMLTVGTLYLSETLGYDDVPAANLWALCAAAYTGMAFVAGFIGDSLGIKRTLHLSLALLVTSRLAIGFSTAHAVVIPALFVISIGTAIMTPILISATKRYTTPKSQAAGFNMLYFLMNVGAFLGNFTLDPLRALPWGNRTVFMAGSVISILCWVSILLLWRRPLAEVDTAARRENGSTEGGRKAPKEKWEAPWTIAWSVIWESAFWRFMLFLIILIGVRLCFEHQSQIYPKYYIRTMSEHAFAFDPSLQGELAAGTPSDALREAFRSHDFALKDWATMTVEEEDARWRIDSGDQVFYIMKRDEAINAYVSNVPVGALNALNPLIICFGVILSTPIVARFKLFRVMYVGIVISAVSMVILALPPTWIAGLFGWSITKAYAVMVISQIVVFSVGEMIWSPRLYEYTAAIAPEGRAASYMGLSYLPQVMARLAEGLIAGRLLTKYCPPDVTERLDSVPYMQSPQFMCLILAALAIASPLLVAVFKGVIQKESRLEKAET